MYSVLVIQMRRIPITKSGYEMLLKKRADLLEQRPDAVKTLKAARELGDLSENGLYKGARSRLSGIDAQLRRLSMQIKLSEIIEPISNDTIQIGSTVKVLENEKEKTYVIVGNLEANPIECKVSINSPIGSALINKKESDSVKINTPKGSIEMTIKKITH